MGERLPVVFTLDLEPDERLVDVSRRAAWTGFEAMVPRMERIRTQLAKATGAPVQFCWMVRMDHQVERVYGRADWALDHYRDTFDRLRAQGDVIGVHSHAWRWDEADGVWIANHGDPAWVAQCARRSLATYRRCMGQGARIFSHGDEFLSTDLMALIARLGVRYELTAVPGKKGAPGMVATERATGALPDLRGMPRVPYRPACHDFRQTAARHRQPLWLLPVTSGLVVDRQTGQPDYRPLLLGAPADVNRRIFDTYRAQFPVTVAVAAARSDVFLKVHDADQFRYFIDHLAACARHEALLVTTPQAACRAYRQRAAAQGLDLARYARGTALGDASAPPARHEGSSDGLVVQALETEVQALAQRLDAIEHSRWWRLRRRLLLLRALLRRHLAPAQRRGLAGRLLRAMFGRGRRNLRWVAKHGCRQAYLWLEDDPAALLPSQALTANDSYGRWQAQHEPRPADLAVYRAHLPLLPLRPRISILLPVFDPPVAWFRETVQSVLDQVYPDWELCIADDACTDPAVLAAIAEFTQRDTRIRAVRRARNGHIVAASNAALALATGEFCVPLDHDDLLAPDALYQNVAALNREPDLDVLYADEDKLDAAGRRCDPHFKPAWSPDTLFSGNYVCHALVARTALVRDVGGFREGFEGAQDLDLVLRLAERTQRIHHVPHVLYHWRKHARSTAHAATAKPYAFRAGQRALQEALARRGERGTVGRHPSIPNQYLVRYELPGDSRTSIIVPTRDQAGVLAACLASLFERTHRQDFDVLIVDNGSQEPATHALFTDYAHRHPGRFAVLRDASDFNFSRLVNAGVAHTSAPYVLLLNNDVEVLEPEWLTAMLEHAQRPAVGCVGARLLYPNGSVQHAGVVLGRAEAEHAFRLAAVDAAGYMGRLQAVSNFSAVTGACLLVRRAVFEQVGGFDETFAVDYNDVDFCLRVREAGYHNLLVPQATLCHHEQLSRGHPLANSAAARRHAAERAALRARWAKYLTADPCLSPHLMPRDGDLRLVA